MSFGKMLVTQKVTTKMSKLLDNICLGQKKKLNLIFFPLPYFWVLPGVVSSWSCFAGLDQINVMDLDTRRIATILDRDLFEPRAIFLDLR